MITPEKIHAHHCNEVRRNQILDFCDELEWGNDTPPIPDWYIPQPSIVSKFIRICNPVNYLP